jgi:hypothetical protein
MEDFSKVGDRGRMSGSAEGRRRVEDGGKCENCSADLRLDSLMAIGKYFDRLWLTLVNSLRELVSFGLVNFQISNHWGNQNESQGQ